MAKMYPPDYRDINESSAERKIFNLLKSAPNTDSWTVLHSLGLSRRPSGPYGEIDFVIVIPGEGVICLEVKGGRVSCDNGVWQTVDKTGRVHCLNKSPFLQSRNSMFALKNSIRKKFGIKHCLSRCPIGSAVAFPDIPCPPVSPEFERTDVLDENDMSRSISKALMHFAKSRLNEFQSAKRIPSLSESKELISFLRPNFEYVVSRGATVHYSEERIINLTEEQYSRLDELECNSRCLFEGAAGTGKTLLALEFSKRMLLRGNSVLHVCYNKLLGDWSEEQLNYCQKVAVTSGTLHSIMRRRILGSSLEGEFRFKETELLSRNLNKKLFEKIYPFYAELANEEATDKYDVLVIDEAQDLFRSTYLDYLNLCLKGGLLRGKWAMFGDFTQQSIFGSDCKNNNLISEYSEHFDHSRLLQNCRNTKSIAEETTLLSGFDRAPFRFSGERGLPVDHRYWRNNEDKKRILNDVIVKLLKEGARPHEIIILSSRQFENSAVAGVDRVAGLKIQQLTKKMPDQNDKSIHFSTIHAFKGLESPYVILVDIEDIESNEPRSLLYIGMSRARSLLILLFPKSAEKQVQNCIREALTKGLFS